MNFIAPDVSPALPELFVLLMACVVVVADAYLPPPQRHLTYRLSQLTLLGAAVLTLLSYTHEAVITFHGQFVRDTLGDILKLGIYFCTVLVFLYSRQYLRDRDLFKGEFYTLALFGVLGMMVLVSANSFLSVCNPRCPWLSTVFRGQSKASAIWPNVMSP